MRPSEAFKEKLGHLTPSQALAVFVDLYGTGSSLGYNKNFVYNSLCFALDKVYEGKEEEASRLIDSIACDEEYTFEVVDEWLEKGENDLDSLFGFHSEP